MKREASLNLNLTFTLLLTIHASWCQPDLTQPFTSASSQAFVTRVYKCPWVCERARVWLINRNRALMSSVILQFGPVCRNDMRFVQGALPSQTSQLCAFWSGWYLTPGVWSLFEEQGQCVHRAYEWNTINGDIVPIASPYICSELKDISSKVSGGAVASERRIFECSVCWAKQQPTVADVSFLH